MTFHLAKLVGHEVVPLEGDSAAEMIEAFESKRPVGKDTVGNASVSTVFLVVNHGWIGPPLRFETMIFGGPHDQWQDRYTTWDEAKAGHDRVVERLRVGLPPEWQP